MKVRLLDLWPYIQAVMVSSPGQWLSRTVALMTLRSVINNDWLAPTMKWHVAARHQSVRADEDDRPRDYDVTFLFWGVCAWGGGTVLLTQVLPSLHLRRPGKTRSLQDSSESPWIHLPSICRFSGRWQGVIPVPPLRLMVSVRVFWSSQVWLSDGWWHFFFKFIFRAPILPEFVCLAVIDRAPT